MGDLAIRVSGLGKRYRLRHEARTGGYQTLREDIMRLPRRVWSKMRGAKDEEFWALKDVSFEVKSGEVVGIIGRNGAGKSTLLKILSRITPPTVGEVELFGQVGSLLEVGTGFHPELTGRENIFLSGAILGMRRPEIRRRFDEIVAFAGVEKFLDTPCKHYSSGMYLRLGFAVAAHLDAEILLVDEVLAVGDAEFQRKCLGKMGEVAKGGRTVLFVSHNLGALQELCDAGICFDRGVVVARGKMREAVTAYLGRGTQREEATFPPRADKPTITRISIDEPAALVGDLVVKISFESPFLLSPPVPGVVITSDTGVPVYGSNPRFHRSTLPNAPGRAGTLKVTARGLPLSGGCYRLSVWLGDWQTDYDQQRDALEFDFRRGSERAMRPLSATIGYLDWEAQWIRI
jgi:lipopolysaccharide transport system ATP-binding protein